MIEGERYIGGATGGVPERLFRPDVGGFRTVGQSGTLLEGTVERGLISITSSYESKRYLFTAYRGGRTQDMLGLNIKTKQGDPPVKHPDLYASKLVERSLSYFEKYGSHIKTLQADWYSLVSEDYHVYNANLEKIQQTKRVTIDDKKDAAKNTWTGKLAKSLGFEEIERLNPTPYQGLIVIFSRP